MPNQTKKENGRYLGTELNQPKRIKLDLAEVLSVEALATVKTADHLVINGVEFLSKERSVELMIALAEKEGYSQAKDDLKLLKEKHQVLRNSFNKIHQELLDLKKDADQYKRLNKTFLQKVKDKIKK